METMEKEKTVDVLNDLVEINNDRIEGYEKAGKETEEQDLKTLFMKFAHTSQKNKEELASEIYRLGGEPSEDTKISGKFFRVWMDVKASLSGKDRKAILNSCEYGEDNAVETYEKVLKDDLEYLSVEEITMITAQYALIKADHFTVKTMRDALAD